MPELGRERILVFAVAAIAPLYLAVNEGGQDPIDSLQFGLVLWFLVAIGFAFGIFPRGRPTREATISLVAFGCLVGWTALSLAWTESDERTFAELARTTTYGGVLLLAWAGLSRSTWRAAAGGLALAIITVPLLAYAGRLAPGLMGADPTLGGERLAYPLGYWNAVGAWASMALVVGLAFGSHLSKLIPRGLALASTPFSGTVVYLTYSRGATVGVIAGVVLVVLVSRRPRATAINASACVAASALSIFVVRSQSEIANSTGTDGGVLVLLVTLAGALACAWVAGKTLRRRRRDDRTAQLEGHGWLAASGALIALAVVIALAPSTASRSETVSPVAIDVSEVDPAARLVDTGGIRGRLWAESGEAFRSAPFLGIGPGTYEFWWTRNQDDGDYVRDAHSLYIESAAELGIPGLLLVVGSLGAAVFAGYRTRRELARSSAWAAWVGMTSATSVFLLLAGVDWFWEIPALTIVALAAVGTAAAGSARPRSQRPRLTLKRAGIVALAVAAAAIQIPSLVSTQRVSASQGFLGEGSNQRAAQAAEDARTAAPWAASPYAQLGTVALRSGAPGAARLAATEAFEREPGNWRHPYLLLQIALSEGDRALALDATDIVEGLNPSIGFGLDLLRQQIESGQPLPAPE